MNFADMANDFFSQAWVRIVLIILVALVAQLIISKSLEKIVRRVVRGQRYENALDERKREDTVISIFHTLSAVIIWIVAVILILAELKVNIAALATGAGLIGIIIGMGAQNIIKDYLAGILIIMENQYRVGDIVSLSAGTSAGVSGVVEEISIRATRLRDLDGNLHIVSNGSAGIITNLSYKFAQVNVDVGVSYKSDIDQVEKIINQVGADMAKHEKWAENIVEPIQFLRVDSFNDSSITIKSLGKVKPAAQWEIAGEFRRRLKVAFEKNGIEIPLPQMVVHSPSKSKAH